jgi:precorrin-8X/cobalt-precorrin-8 methylmutase
MESHVTDAQNLAIIEREIGDGHVFSPAEYEIVRRVIYATAAQCVFAALPVRVPPR